MASSDTKTDPRSKNTLFAARTWKGYVRQYARDLEAAMEQLSETALDGAYAAIATAVREQRRVFVAGNGGSAAIADHLCCDWTKGTHAAGHPPLRTHSLVSNVALLTAVANDFGYDDAFARQLEMLGTAGDVVLLISSSGNSPNVLAAADRAKAMGIVTIGMTGFTGGALAARVDFALHVPYGNYGLVEDCHQILMHTFAQLFAKEREAGVAPT
jgi:D-sedoheptulose 7-phosphate isomerase